MRIQNYSKLVGTGLGGAIGTILVVIFKDQLSPEQAGAIGGGVVAVLAAFGVYIAPANKP